MITKKVLLVDNNMDNSDWVKANAFDFPSVVTVDDFVLQFNVPSVEPARSERLAKLRDYPWAQATPKPIYDLLFADALDKASFGGDRSAAGRYAANMRWRDNQPLALHLQQLSKGSKTERELSRLLREQSGRATEQDAFMLKDYSQFTAQT